MDKKNDLEDYNLEQKKLISRLFETFNITVNKLRDQQRKLEDLVRISDLELTNVLQSLGSGLIVTDLKGNIRTFNRSAVALTGISVQDAQGQNINQLLTFSVLPEPLDKATFELIKNNFKQQWVHKRKGKEPITLDSSTTLMVSEKQEMQGVIINLTDITLLKRFQEEAERKNRLTAMGEIAMQVAHEIRNPLGSIKLFVSMMKKDFEEDSSETELLHHILSAVGSMNHIISNMLEFTRPKPIILDMVNVHSLIKSFVEFSCHLGAKYKVDIKINCEADNPAITGNKELLNQVFQNLFINGCQAMPEGGTFFIHSRNVNETDPVVLERFQNKFLEQRTTLPILIITFKDNGNGMSEDIRKKLFDPFFTTKEQGTGLGMSIVHKTMVSHGGTILVESEEEKGTSISLLFPQVNQV